jgi:hypothetical protein
MTPSSFSSTTVDGTTVQHGYLIDTKHASRGVFSFVAGHLQPRLVGVFLCAHVPMRLQWEDLHEVYLC